MNMKHFSMRWCLLLLVSIGLMACSDDSKTTGVTEVLGPIAFESGDECHVCGMIITELPGAKAEAIENRSNIVHKFCSAQDMLSWWLQPENQHLKAELYVHDIAKTPWNHPQDEHLIDARSAWYVIGSSLQGAMGPSMVSFSDRKAAELLADSKGGRVLSWDQLDLAILQELAGAGHEHAVEHAKHLVHEHGIVEESDDHDSSAADLPATDTSAEHDMHSGH